MMSDVKVLKEVGRYPCLGKDVALVTLLDPSHQPVIPAHLASFVSNFVRSLRCVSCQWFDAMMMELPLRNKYHTELLLTFHQPQI